MLSGGVLANSLGVPDSEYDALVALYNSTAGGGWVSHQNWLTSATPWYGVTIESGHVGQIQLSSNNLSGSLPPQIGNLPNLRTLLLDGNHLTGQIPPEMGT